MWQSLRTSEKVVQTPKRNPGRAGSSGPVVGYFNMNGILAAVSGGERWLA